MSYFQDKYAKQYAQESKVNVYFLPMQDLHGRDYYFYVIVNAMLHDHFVRAMEVNQIPDYAVVVRQGPGVPSLEIKTQMKEYYGFDHDKYEAQMTANANPQASADESATN